MRASVLALAAAWVAPAPLAPRQRPAAGLSDGPPAAAAHYVEPLYEQPALLAGRGAAVLPLPPASGSPPAPFAGLARAEPRRAALLAAAALAHPFAAAAGAGGGAVLRELVQASSPRARRDLAASSHASPARSPAELPLASLRRRTCGCASVTSSVCFRV